MQQRPEAEPEECAEAELEECHATAEPEEYYAPAEPEEDAVAQSEEHPADDPDQADDPAGLLRTRRGHSKSDPMCRVLDTLYIYIYIYIYILCCIVECMQPKCRRIPASSSCKVQGRRI